MIIEDFSPQELIRRLRGAADPAEPSLPDYCEDVLRLAYHLSLESEEGRPLRFVFALEENDYPLMQFLVDPVPADLEQLRRLCMATDPARTCMNISRVGERLCVAGISNAPDAHAAQVLGYRRVLVEVLGHAYVRLSCGTSSVYFDRHEYGIIDGRAGIEDVWRPNARWTPDSWPRTAAGAVRRGRFRTLSGIWGRTASPTWTAKT